VIKARRRAQILSPVRFKTARITLNSAARTKMSSPPFPSVVRYEYDDASAPMEAKTLSVCKVMLRVEPDLDEALLIVNRAGLSASQTLAGQVSRNRRRPTRFNPPPPLPVETAAPPKRKRAPPKEEEASGSGSAPRRKRCTHPEAVDPLSQAEALLLTEMERVGGPNQATCLAALMEARIQFLKRSTDAPVCGTRVGLHEFGVARRRHLLRFVADGRGDPPPPLPLPTGVPLQALQQCLATTKRFLVPPEQFYDDSAARPFRVILESSMTVCLLVEELRLPDEWWVYVYSTQRVSTWRVAQCLQTLSPDYMTLRRASSPSSFSDAVEGGGWWSAYADARPYIPPTETKFHPAVLLPYLQLQHFRFAMEAARIAFGAASTPSQQSSSSSPLPSPPWVPPPPPPPPY
jgi:hypothetical protein